MSWARTSYAVHIAGLVAQGWAWTSPTRGEEDYRFHGQGLAGELRTDGEPPDMATGRDLLAYRVIETALSVAAGHGRGRADVTIEYRPDRLQLQIRADSPLTDPGGKLQAISERVALYHRSMQMLPSDCHPFALQARPLGYETTGLAGRAPALGAVAASAWHAGS
jgi:hypothetical protein